MDRTDEPDWRPYQTPTVQNKLGRPFRIFDLEEIKKLAALGCTDEEIADFVDTSSKTIERRKKDEPDFCRAYKKGRADLKQSLRRTLLKRATDDNSPAAAIFLAKNLLGMRDNPDPIIPTEDDQDWIYRTRLATGDVMVIAPGVDPIEAYHAHIRSKRPKEPVTED